MSWDAVLATPFGPFGIAVDGEGRVRRAAFLPDARPRAGVPRRARAAAQAVEAYLADPATRALAAVALAPAPGPFAARLRALLAAVPAGAVLTYGEAARRLGSAPRAVASALRANPVALFVPCHRVVAAQGPGGYGGRDPRRVRVKLALLAHEGVALAGGRSGKAPAHAA